MGHLLSSHHERAEFGYGVEPLLHLSLPGLQISNTIAAPMSVDSVTGFENDIQILQVFQSLEPGLHRSAERDPAGSTVAKME